MFEGDASFTQIPNAPGGRTYVLKFQSSDQRHFVSSKPFFNRHGICNNPWIVLDAGTPSRDLLYERVVIGFFDRMHLWNVTPISFET